MSRVSPSSDRNSPGLELGQPMSDDLIVVLRLEVRDTHIDQELAGKIKRADNAPGRVPVVTRVPGPRSTWSADAGIATAEMRSASPEGAW